MYVLQLMYLLLQHASTHVFEKLSIIQCRSKPLGRGDHYLCVRVKVTCKQPSSFPSLKLCGRLYMNSNFAPMHAKGRSASQCRVTSRVASPRACHISWRARSQNAERVALSLRKHGQPRDQKYSTIRASEPSVHIVATRYDSKPATKNCAARC